MQSMIGAGQPPHEQALTEICVAAAHPIVRSVLFNTTEEGATGADLLWWFADTSGEEFFGVLLQAKRAKRSGSNLSIDIGYNAGKQLEALCATADHLEVPAGYLLYVDSDSLQSSFDGSDHTSEEQERHSVSVVTAFVARRHQQWLDDNTSVGRNRREETNYMATRLVQRAIPLEDLAISRPGFAFMHSEILSDYFVSGQSLPRSVAAEIFHQMVLMRIGMMERMDFEPPDTKVTGGHRVFPAGSLPVDNTHGLGDYFEESLRGLRTGLPGDSALALEGDPRAIERLSELGVGGVVIVQASEVPQR